MGLFFTVSQSFHWSQRIEETHYKFCIQIMLDALSIKRFISFISFKKKSVFTATELHYVLINSKK